MKENKPKVNPTEGMTVKGKINFYFNDLETPLGKLVDLTIVFLIFVLCVTYVVSTYEHKLSKTLLKVIDIVEFVIIIIFIIEYILRMWVAKKKLKHFFNIYSLIDLISILPFFFTLENLQFMRIFRMIRVFRILRFLRYLRDERFFFGKVKEDQLIIVRIIFTIFSIVFVSSGLIFYEEYLYYIHEGQPLPDGNKIKSLFDAVYYTIVTLTTVGFGDLIPVTLGGKLVTILMIASGVIFLPWQIGSLIRKFLATTAKRDVICKKCGLKYHDKDAVHCKACGELIYQVHESETL
ncbi:MAG: ion transporter [Spirochaetota bacterium]|nr:ion transporter [Spirochaetota bacterium]